MCPSGSLNHLHGTFLGFPLASHFDLPGSQSICYVSGSFHVCAAISWFLPQRCMGRASLDITSPLTSKEPYCACVVKEVSWLREGQICGLGGALLPPLIVLLSGLGVFIHRERNSNCFTIPWPPDFHCTMLSQGKEMWKIAICLCRYWNIHSFFCIVPAVFTRQTWGLRLFDGPRVEALVLVAWLFWVAAHLTTLWVPVLSNWSPLTIPVSLQSAQLKHLSLRATFSPFVLLPLCFFGYCFILFIFTNTFDSLKCSSFWKTKARNNWSLLGFSHVTATTLRQWGADKTTHLNWPESKGYTGQKTQQNKPDLSKIMQLHLLCTLFPLLLSKLLLLNLPVWQVFAVSDLI